MAKKITHHLLEGYNVAFKVYLSEFVHLPWLAPAIYGVCLLRCNQHWICQYLFLGQCSCSEAF
jgi:hypothetical protein